MPRVFVGVAVTRVLAPDELFLDTLRRAARRGVDVRILVPGVTDIRDLVRLCARCGSLLHDGAQLLETQDTVLHAAAAKPVRLEEWRRRSLTDRAMETLSRLVDHWL